MIGSAATARPRDRNAGRAAGTTERESKPSDAGGSLLGRREPFELDTVASRWERALDSAQQALVAAAALRHGLPAGDVGRRLQELGQERRQTAHLLEQLAAITGTRPAPWLSPVPVRRQMLGLPAGVTACLFDLDGVLTDSGAVHASAWAQVFDEFLLRHSDLTGRHFRPFAPDDDYRTYLDGRTRLEGVHAFLASRGIRLPEGHPDDPPDAETAHGLANHKRVVLARGLHERATSALPHARRYVEAVGHAGLKRAVLSASANTSAMLAQARLATLIDDRIDAVTIHSEGLRSRPAPDLVLAACRHLGVDPKDAVCFTQSAAGVAAAHAAGATVVGVADGVRAENLGGFGADRVVPSLGALLDRQLLATRRI